MAQCKGIDVSKHQGTIDWAKVKAAGVQFAMLRAGYGRYDNQKDEQFEANYKGATAAGIPVGAYHYSYATTAEQAKQEAKARAYQSAREAEARTEAMLAGAREDIRNERENAMKQMQSEIGRLAMEAAAKIMESERSSDKDLALYDQFIKKAGDSDDDNSH